MISVDELREHQVRLWVELPAELLGTPIAEQISTILDDTRDRINELMEGNGD